MYINFNQQDITTTLYFSCYYNHREQTRVADFMVLHSELVLHTLVFCKIKLCNFCF